MLGKKETELILVRYFRDCLRFWRSTTPDEREAFQNAIDDIRCVKRDPFTPMGKELDIETKKQFIKYRELDLR